MESTPANQVLAIPEILSMIVHRLDSGSLKAASLVCKDWYHHTRLILWRQLIVRKDWCGSDLTQLWPALDRQGSVTKSLSLELSGAERLNRVDMSLIKVQLTSLLSRLPNLESLHIQFPHETKSNVILTIAEHATKLKQFDTDISSWDSNDMTALLRSCPDLCYVSGRNFTSKVLEAIAATQPTLNRIDCYHPQFDDDELISFAQQFPDLLQLSISFHSFLTSRALTSIAACCPKIEQLEFHFCLCLQSAGFQAVFRAFNNLRVLNLGPSEVYDADIALLAVHCPNLELLKLPFCTNITQVGIGEIVHSCQNLQHLDISWCDKIQLSVFETETPWVCKRLRYLDISGIGLPDSADAPTPEDILHCMYRQLSLLTQLQHLVISGHDFSLRLLEVGGPYLAQLKRLETLNISKLKNPIPWSDVIAIGNLFPRLTQFRFQCSDVAPPLSVIERAAVKKSSKVHPQEPSESLQSTAEASTSVTSLGATASGTSRITSRPSSPKRKRSRSPSPPLLPAPPIPTRSASPDPILDQIYIGDNNGEENRPTSEAMRVTLNSGLEISFQVGGEEDEAPAGWEFFWR
ncbi:F-box and leucine-rich repeat protein 4 [Mortierella sp. AD011]|nr:F-box and leucine-rich repeat protein 4 [Mortierella sp. AD010]KAF9372738.1 F-box and leucine-rich repeat protein 4 [Mortierella sp. AD011]